ncbi:hypothetical protein [Nocardioides sp. SYSU D00038]|uniref:hypothetical protein n=1 Tax=Nocardioides sp. SYSU D00038 TaxID=2812554 RepID=UPI001967B272|nr:hypothetical protein [Nocardioides sp. SYSU D00038]
MSRWWLALPPAAGLLAALAWGPTDGLTRDEAVYAYAGQRLADGVPPYASIADPKGPVATVLASLGVVVARLAGFGDLVGVRAAFLATTLAAGVVVALLAHALWGSRPAAVVAGVALVTSAGLARDAVGGPDAKTPAVLLVALVLLLVVRERWLAAGVAAGLACLTWQPLALPLVALLVVTLLRVDERRRVLARAVVGAAVVGSLTVAGLWAAGSLAEAVDAAVAYPLFGIRHGEPGLAATLGRAGRAAERGYGAGAVGLAVGLLVVLVAAFCARRRWRTDPLVHTVAPVLLVTSAYLCLDLQGYPDLLPLLPHAALGLGLLVRDRRRVVAGGLALVLLGTAVATARTAEGRHELVRQLRAACGVERLLGDTGRLWTLGDPSPLVLTGRANPDRHVLLSSGAGGWRADRVAGGVDEWARRVAATADVVVLRGSRGPVAVGLADRLTAAGFVPGWVGPWRVLVRPSTLGADVRVADRYALVARDRAGRPLPADPATC